MSRILLIEDNAHLAYGLKNNLEIAGHTIDVCEDGASGLRHARDHTPDLLVLDLMLPALDGYRVLKALRDEQLWMPVLILTARAEEADKVMGFRLGADDYVTKPFSLLELIERVSALLRRAALPHATAAVHEASHVHTIGDIRIDERTHEVRRGEHPVPLTPLEFDLLIALVRGGGAVLSRIDLLRRVWGHEALIVTRTIDTHIAELRRKLEDDPTRPRHILTVRKIGYRLQP